jgi:DNA polymerase III delta prime subunit
MCKELGLDYLFINASEDNGIDVLRTRIRSFASTVSLSGGKKVVILDEADYLNPQSTQPALRGAIEEFDKQLSVHPDLQLQDSVSLSLCTPLHRD